MSHNYNFLFVVRTFKIYSQQFSNTYCNNIHYSHHAVYKIPGTYSSSNKFVLFDQHLIIFPTLQVLVTTALVSVSMSLAFFQSPRISGIMQYLSCLTYFTQYSALQVHPYCRKWQDFLLFQRGIVFHHVSSLDRSNFNLHQDPHWLLWLLICQILEIWS